MDLQQLKGFVAVAGEKSFSKAAKRTFRTQSAVSLQIKALEDALGVKLFDRITPRKTELTREGSLLLELASPFVEDFEKLKDRFDEKRGLIKGEIRIATHDPVISYLLPEPIKKFKQAHPEVKITLLRKNKESILSAVLNGDVDLGISSLVKVPPAIDYQVIGKYNRVLVTPRNHPLSKKKEVTLEDIAKYPLILPPKDTSTRRIADEAFQKAGLEYILALEATGRQAIKIYIDLGFGISVFNESLISKEDKKRFFTTNVAKYFGQSERGIIIRKGRVLSQHIVRFIKLLQTK